MYRTACFALIFSPFLLCGAEWEEGTSSEVVFYQSDDSELYEEDVADAQEELFESDEELADAEEEFYESDQEIADAHGEMAPSSSNNEYCISPFHTMHFSLRHTEAGGVGYKEGYSTFEGFGIYGHNNSFMPFVDLRAHVLNDGKWAGNVGIGERSVLSSISHILGVYCYYDVRQEKQSFLVNQVSPGIELVGKRMEYRINGYFPVGKDKSRPYKYRFDEFDGHNIFIRNNRKLAMTGGDAEIGAHLTQSTKYDVYAGAGPYYFNADTTSSWGGKARLLGRFKEYISLEFTYSYDHLFHSRYQGTIGVQLPFGHKLKRKGRDCPQQNDLMLSRASFSPYRFEIPVVKKTTHSRKAINPQTGQPWQVWFVNNKSSSKGTFESPFPTLLQAQNASAENDMIYVFPGDGTSTGMNAGITLANGQKLFGSGISHSIHTTKGRITIPSFSSQAPWLTNAGNIVTLANNNEISGFTMTLGAGNQYPFYGINVMNPTITHNSISTSSFGAIYLLASGKTTVTHNQLTAPSGTGTGISYFIPNMTVGAANISENTISGFNTGISFAPNVNPNSNKAQFLISNNVISNFSFNGIKYSTGINDAICKIEGNTIINNAQTVGTLGNGGISIVTNLAPNSGTFFVKRNTILTTSTVANTFGINSTINVATGSSQKLFIDNNTILTGTGAGSAGIYITPIASSSTMCVSLTNNQIAVPAPSATNGIFLQGGGTAILNLFEFSSNTAPNMFMNSVNFVSPSACP